MEERDRPQGPGWLVRWVPIASWLPRYQRGWLTGDAIAGFTIWGLLIPEMIAYADHVFPTTPAAVAWAQSVADAPAPGLCCLRGDDPPRPPDKR
jgi:hypothetical protein